LEYLSERAPEQFMTTSYRRLMVIVRNHDTITQLHPLYHFLFNWNLYLSLWEENILCTFTGYYKLSRKLFII